MSKTKSILVLDDQVEIALLLSDSLKDEGHYVKYFTCPEKMKEHFRENYQKVDFIITDYHLAPNTTGIDVVRFCHELSETPYILISGNMERVDDNYNRNEVARVEKPFDSDSILELINS